MALPILAVADALAERLNGDGGVGGFVTLGNTAYTWTGKPRTTERYAIITPRLDQSDEDASDTRVYTVTVTVDHYVNRRDGAADQFAAMDRIDGNHETNGGTPSYGFNRWTPGAEGGWDVGTLYLQEATPMVPVGNDVAVGTLTYQCVVSREVT